MDGLRERLPLPPPQTDMGHAEAAVDLTTAYTLGQLAKLPSSLEEALRWLERDTLFANALGESHMRTYLAVKRDESARCADTLPRFPSIY
jgi:glutamine synthetase